jgi:AcrR family transcriptional regulator
MPRPRTIDDAELVAATSRAIGRVGVAKLTLAEVARDAGLAPATLVQRFGSKRGLLLAVAERSADDVHETFARARRANRSPLAALRAALVDLAGTFDEPDELANHLGFLQLDLSDPEFRALALRWWNAAAHATRGLLDAAVEAGELEARVNTRLLARTVLALYSGALVTWGMWREGPLDRWLGRELDVLLVSSGARRSAAGTGTG